MTDRAIAPELRRAQAELQRGNFELAMLACQAILDELPACLPALRILARAAAELGKLYVAVTSFRACADIDPEDEMAHVGLALCADAQGDATTALAELRRALELAPNDPHIAEEVSRRGGDPLVTPLTDARSLVAQGYPERALAVLSDRALRTDIVADLTRARAFWDLGRIDDVWDLCWQISRDHPNCVRALLWLQAAGELVDKPLYVRMIRKQLEQIAPGVQSYAPALQEIANPSAPAAHA